MITTPPTDKDRGTEMNPDTNRFEKLLDSVSSEDFDDSAFAKLMPKLGTSLYEPDLAKRATLVRPDGTTVPEHWPIFQVGKTYEINGYTFKCAYIGETSILFEPAGPIVVGEDTKP